MQAWSNVLRAAGIAIALGFLWLGSTSLVQAQEWVHCATEGGFCQTPYATIVRYGAHGAYTRRHVPPGGVPCNNGVFGDPLVGVHKNCFFRAR